MKRLHNILLAAVFAVALGGCAVLVQYGASDAEPLHAIGSLSALDHVFAGGN